MSSTTAERTGVRCGNRRAHGDDRVYHPSTADVRDCHARPAPQPDYADGSRDHDAAPPATLADAHAHWHQVHGNVTCPLDCGIGEAHPSEGGYEPVAPARPQPDYSAWRQIPVGGRGFGYYAVETANGLRFFRVERPTRGKHKGKTFIKVQASEEFHSMPWGNQVEVLNTIAADPESSGMRYAAEINACTRCGRTLTDEVSRAQGMGPDCVKMGW